MNSWFTPNFLPEPRGVGALGSGAPRGWHVTRPGLGVSDERRDLVEGLFPFDDQNQKCHMCHIYIYTFTNIHSDIYIYGYTCDMYIYNIH